MTYSRDRKQANIGIEKSGNKCVVCGWAEKNNSSGKTLLEGAHLKPFAKNKEDDRYSNIIALCPNHHAEFDALNFYIDYKENKAIFRDKNNIFHNAKLKGNIKHIEPKYFSYRQYMFNNTK